MKRLLLLSILSLNLFWLTGQEQAIDSTLGWKYPGVLNISLAQTGFSNWAAGGENSFAINSLALINANFKSNEAFWDNNLTIGYGLMKQGDKEVRKTDDRLEFNTKFGYKAVNHW